MKFKIGDRVKVVSTSDACQRPIGVLATVSEVNVKNSYGPYRIKTDYESEFDSWTFREENLRLVRNNMAKFYRLLKDHPYFVDGAIVTNEKDTEGNYEAIDELWVKDIKDLSPNVYEYKEAVENNPEWFERVYKVGLLKKTVYLVKEEAQKVHQKLYKP